MKQNQRIHGEAIINEALIGAESAWVYYVVKNENDEFAVVKKPESIVLNESKEYVSSASILRNPVASVYKIFRTVAIVALLTILVYAGIRMVLTSVSRDKAKYRNMMIDWFIALVMVFVLHYLMSLIINISSTITGIVEGSSIENVMLQIPNGTKVQNADGSLERLDEGDEGSDFWATNYIGFIRFYAGLVQNKGYTVKGITYTLMYIVVVIYMVIFTIQYLKRVLYMAFLTMIAPLVAITYPLDKLGDGKAQGFTLWLREYIFNALLQPIHCIIYVVIFGSVMELVTDYPLYGLVALGFMVPAEKFIRKMFGFEKASTVGEFGAAAGAAALMGAVQKISHGSHKNSNNENSEKEKLNSYNSNRGIKTINALPSAKDEDSSIIPPEIAQENQGNNKPAWDSRLSQDQKDDLMAEGIEPGDPEYDMALANYGYRKEIGSNETTGTDLVSQNNMDIDNNKIPIDLENIFGRKTNPKSKINLKDGMNTLVGHYSRRINNSMKKRHPIKALRRGLTYGAGAATLGTIGLAAGIASGDPSKALQYIMAGGMVGGKLGKNIGETASDTIGLENAAEAFKAGALGDAYAEKERQKYNREFKNNVSNYDTAIRKVGGKAWKDMSESGGIIDTSLDYGIGDIGTMCNIYKTQQKLMSGGMDRDTAKENAFRAYKLNSQFGDYNTNSKTQENLNKILDSQGYSEANKNMVKKEILNLMKVYKDISRD